MHYLAASVLIFFSITISAQGYQKAFSAQGSDYIVMMREDAAGNTWIAGTTSDTVYGYTDFFLIKTNFSGDTIFTRTYGTPVYENLTAACLTSDGGILLCGTNSDTTQCILALKISSAGAVQWSKLFQAAQFEDVTSVIQASDGGYLIYGATYGNPAGIFLIKLNANGNLAWGTNLSDGVSAYILAGSVQEYPNGYAFVATRSDTVSADIFIGGVDFSGTLTWSSNLGLTNCVATDFRFAGGGNFILAGYAENGSEEFLAKVNYTNVVWAYTYTMPGAVYPEDLAIDHDGNILMTGGMVDAFDEMYLLKTDSAGTKKWCMQYFENSIGISVSCATNGDYLLGGALYEPGIQNGHLVEFALRLDTSGATGCGNYTVGGLTTALNPVPYPINLSSSGGVITGNYPVVTASGAITWNMCPASTIENPTAQPSIYPNPFSDQLTIDLPENSGAEFQLFDVTGKIVRSESLETNHTEINCKTLLPGIYFYRLTGSDGSISTGKLIAQ
jgi:hypothetical protein